MALQKRIEMETGIVLPEAYIRITEGSLSLDRGTAFIIVETYADVEARNNKKIPVVRTEHKADMLNSQPQRQAEYILKPFNVNAGEGKKLVIDINGDGVMEFELIEGTHITTDGTLLTLANAIADKLNLDSNFAYDFVATVQDEMVFIKAKTDGSASGSKGNTLKITGDMVESFHLAVMGQDKVMSSFEQFFGIEAIDTEGTNVFKQGYLFIKSLPEYEGSIDVI